MVTQHRNMAMILIGASGVVLDFTCRWFLRVPSPATLMQVGRTWRFLCQSAIHIALNTASREIVVYPELGGIKQLSCSLPFPASSSGSSSKGL